MITDRYNYAEFSNGDKMLFDLKVDPVENVNIAGAREHQQRVNELSRILNGGGVAVP